MILLWTEREGKKRVEHRLDRGYPSRPWWDSYTISASYSTTFTIPITIATTTTTTVTTGEGPRYYGGLTGIE